MKHYFGTIIVSCLFTAVSGQYFHETLDLHYNLRSSLNDQQKMKLGFRTYSFLKYGESIPNLLDNFEVSGRFKFNQAQSRFLKNTEWGASLQAFIPGNYEIPRNMSFGPMKILVYDHETGNGSVYSPELQAIHTFRIKDTTLSRFQLAMAIRYNFIGSNLFFSKTYPFGYTFSAYCKYKVISIQFFLTKHVIFNSYTYRKEELDYSFETYKSRISVPDEFRNLTFLTFAFGDDYLIKSSEQEKLIYNIYLTLRRNDYSNNDIRTDFSFKNLDYITGFRINYKRVTINPELTYRKTIQFNYRGNYYSILAGYDFSHLTIKAGFTYSIYYPSAVDIYSLENGKNIYQEKLILSLEYNL